MNPSRLQAEAEPYIPLMTCYAALPPTTGPSFPPPPPPPSFFAPAASLVYLAPPPPPQAGFLGGVQQGCWDTPMAPGGVAMQGAFPHPAWLPLMPVPHGAIAMPPAPPYVTAGAMPQGSGNGKQPPRSVPAGRSPCARPRPRLVVPPRMQPARGPRGPAAASPGAKAADAGGDGAAKEEPSPRSVLVTQSPPISPTTSLPSTFPLPCLPPAPASAAPPTQPPQASAELDTVSPPVSPPKRMKPRRLRRARPASGGVVRRSVPKPRRVFDPDSNHTSLMIRHIPNDFTKERLMAIIDQHCSIENEKIIATGGVRSEYDFLYLPIDFSTLANKGYAFVNMTSPDAARRLWEHLRGHRWEIRRCGKTCAVDDGAIQGLDKLVDHFSGSIFPCDTEEFLPARFDPPRDGTRPFEGVVHVVGRLARRL